VRLPVYTLHYTYLWILRSICPFLVVHGCGYALHLCTVYFVPVPFRLRCYTVLASYCYVLRIHVHGSAFYCTRSVSAVVYSSHCSSCAYNSLQFTHSTVCAAFYNTYAFSGCLPRLTLFQFILLDAWTRFMRILILDSPRVLRLCTHTRFVNLCVIDSRSVLVCVWFVRTRFSPQFAVCTRCHSVLLRRWLYYRRALRALQALTLPCRCTARRTPCAPTVHGLRYHLHARVAFARFLHTGLRRVLLFRYVLPVSFAVYTCGYLVHRSLRRTWIPSYVHWFGLAPGPHRFSTRCARLRFDVTPVIQVYLPCQFVLPGCCRRVPAHAFCAHACTFPLRFVCVAFTAVSSRLLHSCPFTDVPFLHLPLLRLLLFIDIYCLQLRFYIYDFGLDCAFSIRSLKFVNSSDYVQLV